MKKKIVACFLLFAMIIALVPAGIVQAATYKKGSKGTNVKYVQQNLNFLGFPVGTADGSFGNNTRKAVLLLQESIGFPQTGVVDEELNTLIKDTVADIQKYLQYKGYYSGAIDGVSGLGTEKALKNLQKEKGKVQTGFVDFFILKEITDDTASKVEMKALREWIERLKGTYGNTLESEYYTKYGKEYLELFYEYPEVLDFFDEHIDYETSQAHITHKDACKEQDEAIVWEGIANGVPFLIDYLYGAFGVTEDQLDTVVYSTVMSLVKKMYYKDNTMIYVANEVEDAVNSFADMYSFADESSKEVLIDMLMKTHPELTQKTIEKIVDTIAEEWEEVSTYLTGATVFVECVVAALELYSISDEYLMELKQSVQQPSVLYSSLCYLEEVRGQSEEEFITKYLISELSEVLVEELLNQATGYKYEVIVGTLRVLSEIFVEATVDEQLNANMMKLYCMSLKNTLVEMREDLVENADYYIESEMNQKIKNYEIAYNFYLCSLETYYESVLKMTADWPWDRTKEVIQSDIDFLKDYNYDLYAQMCLVEAKKIEESEITVIKKMDYLLDKIGVEEGKDVYFTINHKSCSPTWISSHGCTNCNMSDIVDTTDFIKVFGKISVDNFPKQTVSGIHDLDHTGQSCFGFTCFAQWYLYADSATEDVIGECVNAVAFNRKNMEKYVQPGDVIRVNGHSMLVYSIEENGLMVIDCNWGFKGQLNCLVQKHLLDYNNTRYAGGTAFINRVTKTSYGQSNAGTYDVDTGVTVTYASLAGTKTTTPTITATPKPTVAPTVTPVPTEVPTPTPEPVVSGWVQASDCPAGATIVDTKWTYTYTERTEATNATLDGWIRDGERKEVVASGTFDYATFPDTFDTSHTVYTSMYTNKNTVPVADGAVREFISDTPTGYVYWHYSYPVGGGGNAENRIVGYYYNQNLKYVGSWCYATEFCAFKSAKNYTSTANNKEGGGTVYKVTDSDYMKYDVAKGSYWWYRFEYNTCTYQDVKSIYQYYRTSNMESTSEVKEGNGYSNVVKWVRYK